MKKFLVLFFMLFLTGCSLEKYETYYTDLFDTFSSFTCYTDSQKDFDDTSDKLYDKLSNLNKNLDIYNNYQGLNNIKTINDNAGISPVKVEKDVLEIIKTGKEAYTLTNGKINIAMGSVLKIWHNYREDALNNPENAKVPTKEELETANKHTDINSIVIDEENSTVFITDKDTSIDVGALAKGFCCDKAKDFLNENVKGASLLNLGGNIICINDNNKKTFEIGVQDPDNEKDYIEKKSLSDTSAVTSGNYQRYFEVNGEKYHHIIDPETLMPANYNKSVTIFCNDSTKADIFSTYLFMLPYEE
ncbi:MAG: FAD:protein FMN transferase, partial [Lachnospirales bacterium]